MSSLLLVSVSIRLVVESISNLVLCRQGFNCCPAFYHRCGVPVCTLQFSGYRKLESDATVLAVLKLTGLFFCCHTKGRDHVFWITRLSWLTSWLLFLEVPTIDLDVTKFSDFYANCLAPLYKAVQLAVRGVNYSHTMVLFLNQHDTRHLSTNAL